MSFTEKPLEQRRTLKLLYETEKFFSSTFIQESTSLFFVLNELL